MLMSRIFCFIEVVSAVLLTAMSVLAAPDKSAPQYVEGEVLVTFKSSLDLPGAKRKLQAHGLGLTKHFARLSAWQGRHSGVVSDKTKTTAALLAELQKDPDVETVEPNYIRHALSVPNDPLFPQLWALQNTGQTVDGVAGTAGHDIQFLQAWNLAASTTNPPVVAVVDSGVYYEHPDLASNMWVNPQETPGNGLDDDGDGYVDDYHGYNFAGGTPDPMDSGEHGTHVSGTIAAVGNNLIGVQGVNPLAKIMPLRVSNDGESMSTSAIIEAIDYAVMMKKRGVNVVAINASYGGGGYSSTDRAAVQAAGDAGIIMCAAAGNETSNNDTTPTYPAGYRLPNMIVVAATDQRDQLASFSNYGATTVDLGAPGVNILSTVPVGLTSYVQTASATYGGNPLEYAGTTSGLTAQIYDCGLGYPSNFSAQVRGNIALISRGALFFNEKVANAMAAGAVGAIIYNNTNVPISATLQYASNWIPAMMLSQADGLALVSAVPTKGTLFNDRNPSVLYKYLDGTSMATPHVSGAVAFAALNFPEDGVTQRVQRVLAAVDPVPALSGKVATGGRLNLRRIVDSDGNGLPDWWEIMYFGATGVDPNADPDGDGASNLQEFLAGTDPTTPSNSGSSLRLTLLPSPSGTVLSWSSGGSSPVYLQRTSTPWLANSWVDIYTNNTVSAASLPRFTDAQALTNTAFFYRLRQAR